MVAAAGCCSSRTYMRKCYIFILGQGRGVLSDYAHGHRRHCTVGHELFTFTSGPKGGQCGLDSGGGGGQGAHCDRQVAMRQECR
jgi:hypothetical protein